MIELTEQQRQAVKKGEAVHITASELGEEVVLLSAKQYESMCDSPEDQREQRAILQYSMKQAAREIHENQPIRQSLIGQFLCGAGSVLEVFPSGTRFDSWRVGQDVDVNEWPIVVRRLLAELAEDSSERGVPV